MKTAGLITTTLGGLVGLSLPLWAADFDQFERSIRPVLVEHCYECHSADAKKIKGGLRLDTRDALRLGGDSGPAINPSQPEKSLILQALHYQDDLEMPPSGKLPDSVIRAFEQWIAAGAPDPRSETTHPSTQRSQTKAPLWSLSPIANPEPPQVKNSLWPQKPLDRFILADLEGQNIQPNKDADWYTFLRRLNYDLIGLPPTPSELVTFRDAAERDPNHAIEKKVDFLLASPRFGERWGRHWLDVARYADSNGQSRDVLFPHAWRYRNWVIDAFNRDLPYDAFVRHQIAGDLIPANTTQEALDQQLATGFLAIGSKPLVAGNLQLDLIDDQIDAVSRSFLGLTVSCARCHDHKFDPITTAEYYSLGGIFNSTKTFYGGGPKRPKSTSEAAKVWLTISPDSGKTLTRLAELEAEVAALTKSKKKRQNRLKKLRKSAKKNEASIQELKANESEATKNLKRLTEEIEALPVLFAMGVRDQAKPKDLAIRVRGDKTKLGDTVARGFLEAVDVNQPISIKPDRSGRIELAQWITHPSNPLTARVAVNRVWSHLFGRGLVTTLDNFGRNGEPPSHPELLDHLAQRFVAEQWSVKSLIKEITTSRTYRLGATFSSAAFTKDPENTLYWRANRRRLEVEPIHDTLLALGNQLNETPPHASVVAEIGEGEVGRGINTKPLEAPFQHRGVYLPVLRTALIGLHKTFDYPDPSSIQGQRDSTNVPTQSLFMMNSPLVIENAERLAAKIRDAAETDSERVEYAYLYCYSRPPSAEELADALSFIGATPLAPSGPDNWTAYCHALLAAAEFRYLN